MARMHSRKHGRSGSKKPVKRIRQEWLAYDKEEVEKLIIKLAKEGKTASQTGIILRDQYGIPDVRVFGMRVAKAMEKAVKKEVPEDIYNLMRKAVLLHRHLAAHKGDAKAIHGVELVESKIRRLGKYYARTGKLPSGWKYSLGQARLLVK